MNDLPVSRQEISIVANLSSEQVGIELVEKGGPTDAAVSNIGEAQESPSPQLSKYSQEILPNVAHQTSFLKDIMKLSDRSAELVINANKANTVLSSFILSLSHVLDAAREATVFTDFEADNALNKTFPALIAVLAIGHIAVRASHAMQKQPVETEVIGTSAQVLAQETSTDIKTKSDTPTEKVKEADINIPENIDLQDSYSIEIESGHQNISSKKTDSNQRINVQEENSSDKKNPTANHLILKNPIRGLAVMSRLLSYYTNPAKQGAIDTGLVAAEFAAKAPRIPIQRLKHLTTLVTIASNIGSMNTFRYFGTALDFVKPEQPLRGKSSGHPLGPVFNSTDGTSVELYRDMPHNVGASRAYVPNPFKQFLEAIIANQKDSLTVQLNRGARALMMDIKRGDDGTILSNHESLDYGLFISLLKELAEFLNHAENVNERVLLLIENTNDVSIEELAKVFTEIGLYPMLPKELNAWKPQHLNDPRYNDARVFPVIGRSWNGTGAEPGFARSLTVTGGDTPSYKDVIKRSGWYSAYPRVAVLQSNWNHTIPNKNDCPLSCEPITDIACIEVANHFGWPVPEMQSHLRDHVEEHAKNCLSQNPNQNLYLSTDHTQLLN